MLLYYHFSSLCFDPTMVRPTIFTIQDEHVNHSTSEVVWDIEKRIFEASN
jgi:hypothetical protein